MFTIFVLGLIAGAVAPYAEPHVKRALEEALMATTPLDGAELRGLALALCLLVAALLGWLITDGGAVALTLGAVLGVFGPRLAARMGSW